jgi:hypothetical protein
LVALSTCAISLPSTMSVSPSLHSSTVSSGPSCAPTSMWGLIAIGNEEWPLRQKARSHRLYRDPAGRQAALSNPDYAGRAAATKGDIWFYHVGMERGADRRHRNFPYCTAPWRRTAFRPAAVRPPYSGGIEDPLSSVYARRPGQRCTGSFSHRANMISRLQASYLSQSG